MPDTFSSIDHLADHLAACIEEDVISEEPEPIPVWLKRKLRTLIQGAWDCKDAKNEAEFAACIWRCYTRRNYTG